MELSEKNLIDANKKVVNEFGAKSISNIKELPKFYTFKNGLIFSHRDFDKFLKAIYKGEKCAIVSGLNASGTLHLGHKPVFDTNLFFQKKFGVNVFIPISDDESYVAGKINTQEEALKNSLELAKELLAYGFDPHKTYFIIDQIYTNIYNLAIKLSKKINVSEIKATYGYGNEENIGLHFYPAIQSAHIILPQEKFGIKNVLVPIGPDEDTHIRICRDVSAKMGYEKPAVIHTLFLPGLDGQKMSKSKNNGIFFKDDDKAIRSKVGKAISGGQRTIEEHRELGGDPQKDISFIYLSKFFLDHESSEKLSNDYKKGKILSSDLKNNLTEQLIKIINDFKKRLEKITQSDLNKSILKNE